MPRSPVTSSSAPRAIGPYSQAVWSGNQLFCSGQTPIDPSTATLVPGGIAEQTAQAFNNLESVLSAAGLTLDDVIKVNVYLTSMSHFGGMNAVYQTRFTPPFPARTTVAVAELPLNAPVELDLVVEVE